MSIIGLLVNFKKDLFFAFQIRTESIIVTHYGQFGELLEDLEAQFMLDNDKIAKNVGDIGTAKDAIDIEKAQDVADVEKIEDVEDGGDRSNTFETGNTRDTGDAEDTGDKKI